MLRPEMTADTVEKELSNPKVVKVIELDANSEYVKEYKRQTELFNQAFSEGLLNEDLKICVREPALCERAREFCTDIKSIGQKLTDLVRKTYLYNDPVWEVLKQDKGDAWIHARKALQETLNNAIDHGANWCAEGAVKISIVVGDEGFAFYIDQPLQGPDYQEIQSRIIQIQTEGGRRFRDIAKYFARNDAAGYERGKGIVQVSKPTAPWISGIRLSDTGYRTIIFETLKRADDAHWNKGDYTDEE